MGLLEAVQPFFLFIKNFILCLPSPFLSILYFSLGSIILLGFLRIFLVTTSR